MLISLFICVTCVSSGRFFDVHGEYNKDASLWTSNTLNKIKEAKKCVADFYSKHTAGPYDLGDKGIKMVSVFM